ncbi:SWR1-complex protein 5 [Yarrowia lipolytica]|uniref:SWR1-complex protein 5 n=1 Tax=Yarrowia lipolytica TaxID=4952 RepID=A0A371CG46_YARLL|nr:SWR1-complex protein 5 [Yarrowia lipolytica]RDW31383.1 SWR1-complex protein 5 [Yarrowia lipolytica]RDW41520.1 SWR1-complex protein 5 [Yarrowia lipolytica]RDW47616.1 SWR1-complex protein 5 [Yarrowia lipolytica]RDW56312.1 SWR1-complex protein 5 [Yarrowia lipolytica]
MTNEDLLSDSENDEDFAYKSDKEEDFSDSDDESRKLQRRIDAENKQAMAKEEVKVDKDAMRKIYEEMKSGSGAANEIKPVTEKKPDVTTTQTTQQETASTTPTASTTSTTTSTTSAPAPASIPSSAATNKVKKPKRPKKGSLLDAMNKPKKKLNTLEQSKADWGAFVDKEGIGHDLSQHNKDGYLEKRDFLDTH